MSTSSPTADSANSALTPIGGAHDLLTPIFARTRADQVVAPRHTWARHYRIRLFATDVLIVAASVFLAVIFRFGLSDNAGVRLDGHFLGYWVIAALVTGSWLFVIGAYRTRDARVVGVGSIEYKRIVAASLLTFGLLAIFFLIAKIDIARGFFVVTLPLGLVTLLLSRWAWRCWLNRQRRFGHYLSTAIVVGKPQDVAYVVTQINKKTGAAYQVVGVATKAKDSRYVSVDGASIPVVSGLDNVAGAARALAADVVIVAGQPAGGSNFIRNLGWELEGTHAELVLASRLTNVAGPRIHMRPVEGLPLMHVELPQYEGGKHVIKRGFDFAVSAFALLLLAPLMIVIAIIVRADSPGPALFRQQRVGRNGTKFTMLKFRSMGITAEADLEGLLAQNQGAGGVLFKLRQDPRVTRVGAVLRKYSLDELPQLWNIFIGDMSLVGPRPPLMREVEQYESHVHRRLFIKPGLTGMWQVNGRSNLDWDESVTLDLYYVENWSLTGDLVILWRTFTAMKNSTGAY